MTSELKPCPFCGGCAIITEFQGKFCAECDNSACPPKPVTPMIETLAEAVEDWNTRAVPASQPVTEVVRWKLYPIGTPKMISGRDGDYVEYDQHAAVVAAKDAEILFLNERPSGVSGALDLEIDERINTQLKLSQAEVKLAQSEKQEAVKGVTMWMGKPTLVDHDDFLSGLREPLYAHPVAAPVASDAELRAENERLEQSKEQADQALVDKYRDPQSGHFNFPSDVAKIIRRLDAAEAKLAQSEMPVAYTLVFSKSYGINAETTFKTFEAAEKYAIRCELPLSSIIPLYTAPVTSDAEMRAENEELRGQAQRIIAAFDEDNDLDDPEKFNAYFDLKAALNPSEARG